MELHVHIVMDIWLCAFAEGSPSDCHLFFEIRSRRSALSVTLLKCHTCSLLDSQTKQNHESHATVLAPDNLDENWRKTLKKCGFKLTLCLFDCNSDQNTVSLMACDNRFDLYAVSASSSSSGDYLDHCLSSTDDNFLSYLKKARETMAIHLIASSLTCHNLIASINRGYLLPSHPSVDQPDCSTVIFSAIITIAAHFV